MLYVLCVITSSNIFGAFWGPHGLDFHVGVQVSLGALTGWKAGEGKVEGAHGSRTGQERPATLPTPARLPADSAYLRQEAEVSVQDGIVGAVEEFQEVVRQEMECIGRGQLRKEFLLLCLVVQDFCLRVTEGKKSGRFRRLLRAISTFPYLQSQKALR